MATKRHELVDELLLTRRQAQRLAISLRFQGRKIEAYEAEEKEKDLTAQIDTLLATGMETWIDKAAELTEKLKGINQRLTADVDSVRKREQNAGRIAGALGAIADVLELVGRLTL